MDFRPMFIDRINFENSKPFLSGFQVPRQTSSCQSCIADMTASTYRRRNILFAGIASVFASLFSRDARASDDTNVVHTHMRRGNPPSQPLDTMLLFERGDENNGAATTHEVLSLVHEEKGKNSFPWTLYTSL